MFGGLAPGLGDSRALLDDLRPRLPVVLGRHQHPGLRGRAAGCRTLGVIGDVGARGAADRRRRGGRSASLGSATRFAPSAMVPRARARELLGTVSLWSSFCFAFAGFEIGAFASQEIHDPERTLPRGIAISGADRHADLHRGHGGGARSSCRPTSSRSAAASPTPSTLAATQHRPAGGRAAHRVPAGRIGDRRLRLVDGRQRPHRLRRGARGPVAGAARRAAPRAIARRTSR